MSDITDANDDLRKDHEAEMREQDWMDKIDIEAERKADKDRIAELEKKSRLLEITVEEHEKLLLVKMTKIAELGNDNNLLRGVIAMLDKKAKDIKDR